MAEKNQIMLIDIERLFLHCFARVAYCYGISKRAVLNPAALLHNLRGIIFIFSENGCMISSVVAFTGLPGGYRNNNNGNYNNMGNNGYFWSSTEGSNSSAWSRVLYYYTSAISRNNNNKKNGFSVRCIRDLV